MVSTIFLGGGFKMPTKKKPETIIWIFAALTLIGLLNGIRQYYVGSGIIAERLAMFSFAEGVLAAVALLGLWKRTKWAFAVVILWAVESLAWGIIGTLMLMTNTFSVWQLLPGMTAVVIGVLFISFKAKRHFSKA